MKTLFISHSPTTKSKLSGRWYKSIKNRKGIGGKIVANVFGDTKEEAENMAQKIVAIYNTVSCAAFTPNGSKSLSCNQIPCCGAIITDNKNN